MSRRRILILRSSRLAPFLAAVVVARRRHPDAEIVALSHRGHEQVLRAAGVDRVIEIPGRRFSVVNIAPWTLAKLRTERFDEVLVPQMTAEVAGHVNLYRVVLALNPRVVVIIPGDGHPEEFDRASFASLVLRHSYPGTLAGWDAAMVAGIAIGLCERYLAARLR
jgi:hypothetical protein